MYQLTTDPTAIMNLDNCSQVPVDDSDYQAWLAAGNTPLPIALGDAQQYQYAIIVAAAQAAQTTGIVSRAMGVPYIYSAEDADMVHYNSMVVASMLPQLQGQTTYPVLVQDTNGIWAYVQHGGSQVQQAGADLFMGVAAILTKKQDLINQIMAAPDAATAMAVNW